MQDLYHQLTAVATPVNKARAQALISRGLKRRTPPSTPQSLPFHVRARRRRLPTHGRAVWMYQLDLPLLWGGRV